MCLLMKLPIDSAFLRSSHTFSGIPEYLYRDTSFGFLKDLNGTVSSFFSLSYDTPSSAMFDDFFLNVSIAIVVQVKSPAEARD